MARSYVSPNVVNRFELQPRSGERSYNLLGDCQMPNDSRLAKQACGRLPTLQKRQRLPKLRYHMFNRVVVSGAARSR